MDVFAPTLVVLGGVRIEARRQPAGLTQILVEGQPAYETVHRPEAFIWMVRWFHELEEPLDLENVDDALAGRQFIAHFPEPPVLKSANVLVVVNGSLYAWSTPREGPLTVSVSDSFPCIARRAWGEEQLYQTEFNLQLGAGRLYYEPYFSRLVLVSDANGRYREWARSAQRRPLEPEVLSACGKV